MRADDPRAADPADPEGPAAASESGGDPDPAPPRRRHRRRRIVLGAVSIVIVAVVAASIGFVVYFRGNITTLDVGDTLADPSAPPAPVVAAPPQEVKAPARVEVDEDPLNILLMGSDTREGQGGRYGSELEIGGARSDTTLLVHISGDRQSVTALSIPRDLVTTIPSCRLPDGSESGPYEDRFNAAFYLGGPECTIRTVTELTGVPVHHFAVVDFRGFTEVVDALGGVEICLAEAVSDPLADLYLKPGIHTIEGDQALGFVRTRTGGLGDGSDLARIERQQEFLASMVRQATSLDVVANPVKLFRTLNAVTKSLTVDKGIADVGMITELVTSLAAVGPEGVSFVTLPNYYSADFLTVRLDRRASTPILDSMINDRAWPAPLASVEPQSLAMRPGRVDVTVVDRTGAGRSGENAAAYLDALGFGVVEVWAGDATETTTVRYPPRLREKAAVLAASLTDATAIPDRSVDGVQLVLGSDYDSGRFRRLPATAYIVDPGSAGSTWSPGSGGRPTGQTRSAAEATCVS